MTIRLGIHPSVGRIFPPSLLQSMLSDAEATVDLTNERLDASESFNGLVTFGYDPSFLDAGLDWIHVVRAGYDEFPLETLRDHEITLSNSTGIHGDAVGEAVVGYLLQFARGLHRYRLHEPDHEWNPPAWDDTFTLDGESVCVVGLGTLGRGIARRADALGMSVSGVRRTPTPVDHVETRYVPQELLDAVSDVRFVVVAVPLTDRTEEMVGAEALSAMRDDAYLVNVARGPVVDQSALVDALRSASIAGAALDVFEEEPLPPESPLWEMEHVVITPHAAAATEDYPNRIAALVRENSRRLAAGESLANRVV
ncbi:D-2-hydroxyacid dehydrogenase [Halogeometricum borinquense]|uniref:D-2-hydroxyacid dehydrogenase n=1 Tax=Halogeometricum borinquense TaxID=60847 RepID=A0A482TB56_9EURY|nr:D-2-hydroxyacid dehydrogenase [Halogeometricum borinquense]RYJ15174.1 D-2-hydroxyacid dehydrogenase [Halogeometricum borinquense]